MEGVWGNLSVPEPQRRELQEVHLLERLEVLLPSAGRGERESWKLLECKERGGAT